MNRKIASIVALGVGIGIVLLIVFFIARSGRQTEEPEINSVNIQKNGVQLVVSRDGSVVMRNEDGVFFDQWDKSKTDAFFAYFNENYAGEEDFVKPGQNTVQVTKGQNAYSYVLEEDDEIIDEAADDAENPDGGGPPTGGGGGEPTPSPPPGPGSGGTPAPTAPPSGPDPECLYWKLSYCVQARPPTPTPTPPPDPDASVVDVPDCGGWLSEQGEATIISNTVCIPEPTPTP